MVVFDLVGIRHELPLAMLHRVRQTTVRARGLVWFVTEPADDKTAGELVPASMASLRLTVVRSSERSVSVALDKSRICKPGNKIEVVV